MQLHVCTSCAFHMQTWVYILYNLNLIAKQLLAALGIQRCTDPLKYQHHAVYMADSFTHQ